MNENLYEELGKQKREKLGKSLDTMERLAVLAEKMGQQETSKGLHNVRQQLSQDHFNLMVVGRFNSGKSTFLNSLLGKIDSQEHVKLDGELLPTDELPATATLTRVSYGEKPLVYMWSMDGKRETWTFEKYQKESKLREENDESLRFFENIREFEVLFPAELVKQGVTVIDTPGTDEDSRRTLITENAMRSCDAAFLLFRSDALFGQSELNFVEQKIAGEGLTHCFVIVNLIYDSVLDERKKRYTWDRLKLGKDGEKYQGQDFADYGIYFINCLKAYEGVKQNKPELIKSSGLALFTGNLTRFLMSERFQIHSMRWIERAIKYADDMEKTALLQLTALSTDREKIEANYRECLPKLQDIRKKRTTIENIFQKYSGRAVRETQISYQAMLNDLESNLEEEMVKRPFQSLRKEGFGGILDRFKVVTAKKKLAEEASTNSQDIIKKRLDRWHKEDLSRAIGSLIEEMMEGVQAEAASIDAKINEINMSMTDLTPDSTNVSTQGTSLTERLVWAALGLTTGNVDWAIYGAALGWKGVLRGFITEVGVGSALVIFGGLALGPAVLIGIAAGILANLVGVFIDSDKQFEKIKRETAQKILKGDLKAEPPLPRLHDQMIKALPGIEQQVEKYFAEMNDRVIDEVDVVIREEEQKINTILENSRRESQDRARKIQELQRITAEIKQKGADLNSALITARQS